VIVEQIWTANNYRNFNYLVACPETGEALAIDPLDHEKCLAAAKARGWTVTQVLNTHEHGDHIGGNRFVIAATGAKLLAHAAAKDSIPGIDRGLKAGDKIKVGRTVELQVLDTPGHTMSHVCLLAHANRPGLFCGDTLFNAGAGNCHNGGHPKELYRTFAGQLYALSDDTVIYPGHDYIENNLRFTLDREPDNAHAAAMLKSAAAEPPERRTPTTIGVERGINTFFRLDNPSVIRRLREAFPSLPEKPDPEEVFLLLRRMRNDW
jgi:hydroxyacylglutathione hydrolase